MLRTAPIAESAFAPIQLCAGDRSSVHEGGWPDPDPAAVQGTGEGVLQKL